MIEDLALAAEAKAALVGRFPSSKTSAENGTVHVKIDAPPIQEEQLTKSITEILKKVEGVQAVRVHVIPFPLISREY